MAVKFSPALAREERNEPVVDERHSLVWPVGNPAVTGDDQLSAKPLVDVGPTRVRSAGRDEIIDVQKLESVISIEAVHHRH
jgi:hypothetical protein